VDRRLDSSSRRPCVLCSTVFLAPDVETYIYTVYILLLVALLCIHAAHPRIAYHPCFLIFNTRLTAALKPSLNLLRQRSLFSLFRFMPGRS